jgi:hypothetical protein
MASSGVLVRVGLVRTDVSEKPSVSKAQSSSETSVLKRVTTRNIPEDSILHSHRRENLKSYTDCILFTTSIFVSFNSAQNLTTMSPKIELNTSGKAKTFPNMSFLQLCMLLLFLIPFVFLGGQSGMSTITANFC